MLLFPFFHMEKQLWVFVYIKYGKILKHFAETFHQAQTLKLGEVSYWLTQLSQPIKCVQYSKKVYQKCKNMI